MNLPVRSLSSVPPLSPPSTPPASPSGVLRFASPLRVTEAKPGGGGLFFFISRSGLDPVSAFLRRARLR